ncbi:cyclic GMP-AMP synthase DncV-like nucleotidyltransferase, partial [Escherichia coli]
MDIDDGTYLPMALFDDKPIIGHRLLLLLVDTSLQSLVAENDGWIFEAKRTCARIKIPSENTHIDVPMYAIPEDQYVLKEVAIESFRKMAFDSVDARAEAWMVNRDEYELDSDSVNLALREGEQKWAKSD